MVAYADVAIACADAAIARIETLMAYTAPMPSPIDTEVSHAALMHPMQRLQYPVWKLQVAYIAPACPTQYLK